MISAFRADDIQAIDAAMNSGNHYDCAVIGHESCPYFYRQEDVDTLIDHAESYGLAVKVNVPIVFEDYLDYFKKETVRLTENYPSVKLIVNDWGMLYYLHGIYPDKKFAAGLGISFSYADCPWNFHIVEEEHEKYRKMLETHNFDSSVMLQTLFDLGVNEIIMGDMDILEDSYRRISEFGMMITINKNVNIVTISRACHILRILGKTGEKGVGCSKYCRGRTIIKGTHYYDMALNIHSIISEETSAMQPEMYFYSNILFARNPAASASSRYASAVIEDYRY